MIEIIPNWHPIFVHFSVALVTTAVAFYWLSFIAGHSKIFPSAWAQQFENVGRWCLWISALITIGTLAAGLYAYYTVRHDELSHIAMTNHRNWALSTASLLFLNAAWSVVRYRQQKRITLFFLVALLLLEGLLLSTAWRGAELVYRYGLGVMSLPQDEGPGHQHHHSHETTENQPNTSNSPGSQLPVEHHHDTNANEN